MKSGADEVQNMNCHSLRTSISIQYRIYAIKHRGVYYVFSVSNTVYNQGRRFLIILLPSAAFIRGRRLIEKIQ